MCCRELAWQILPLHDAHALITLLLSWNDGMEQSVGSAKSDSADGHSNGVRGGYSAAEIKVLSQQVLTSEFDAHISRCIHGSGW